MSIIVYNRLALTSEVAGDPSPYLHELLKSFYNSFFSRAGGEYPPDVIGLSGTE
jgi:hypothetical protein